MYVSLRERPRPAGPAAARRRPVARVVVTLGVVSLLTDISSESVAAILPIYLTAVVGLSPVSYGLVDGLQQGTSALVRVAAGWTADRSGRPKHVATFGYALSVAARFGLLVSTGAGAVAAVVSVDRIGKGLRTAPRDAMIAASADPEDLGAAFGVHRSLDTLGAMIGPFLAFTVLWLLPDGYGTVLALSAAFAVLGLAVLGLFVPASTGAVRRAAGTPPVRLRAAFAPATRRLLAVAGVLGLLTVGDGFVYLALLDGGDFDAQWFPLLSVGTTVSYLLLAVPLGLVADRWGRPRVFALGHTALAAAYLCGAVGEGRPLATVAALALLGTFYAATDGVLAAIAGRLVPPQARASGIAGAQTVVAVARLLASSAFGLLWVGVGPRGGLLVVGLALVVATPLALLALRGLDPVEPDAEAAR